MGKLSLPCTLYCKNTMRSAPEARGSPLEGGAEVTSPGGLTWKDEEGKGRKNEGKAPAWQNEGKG